MRIRFSGFSASVILVLFSLVLAFSLLAKDKAPKPPKMSNIQGRVEMINKDKSTITVANGNVKREVVYSGDTKFMFGHSRDNKPGAADQVKEGNYISCGGTFDGPKLTAKECVYRERK
jgi:hypothetical protein